MNWHVIDLGNDVAKRWKVVLGDFHNCYKNLDNEFEDRDEAVRESHKRNNFCKLAG